MGHWKIKSGTNSGTSLVGYRIFVTRSGGTTTYKLKPPKAVGDTDLGETTSSPPSFSGININGQTWTIGSGTTPTFPPAKPATWSGTCNNGGAQIKQDPGSWNAEATGGTGEGGKGQKSTKGQKSAKGTSKKSAKGTKSASKKGTKSTKGAKKTRGRA